MLLTRERAMGMWAIRGLWIGCVATVVARAEMESWREGDVPGRLVTCNQRALDVEHALVFEVYKRIYLWTVLETDHAMLQQRSLEGARDELRRRTIEATLWPEAPVVVSNQKTHLPQRRHSPYYLLTT